MCGIFFACSRVGHVDPDVDTLDALRARGPDSLELHRVRVVPGVPDAGVATSPSDENGYFLTFASSVLSLRGDDVCAQPLIDSATGSVFCWNGEAWKIDDAPVCGNDTKQILKLLLDASAGTTSDKLPQQEYLDSVTSVLTRVAGPYAFVYYDAATSTVFFGRDRLGRRSLVRKNDNSAATDIVLASLSLDKHSITEVTTAGVHCLDLRHAIPEFQLLGWLTDEPSINKTELAGDQDGPSVPSSDAVAALSSHLSKSISLRVLGVPTYTAYSEATQPPSKVAILFSGGLDCTLLARIAHDVLPIDQPIDLLNVAFENPRTVRAAAQSKTDRNGAYSIVSPYEACPDRITARHSFTELTEVCPNRIWRFVAIDIPYSETSARRQMVIKLMSPHNTEMDLSITLALYFASRGRGQMTTVPNAEAVPYTTTSRVLLSGLGADELFGGYARHAAAFNRAGFAGLNDELELDFTRIGTRNLGRDDRVMAHWGREVRYPYLDEDFVAFALGLPAWEKVGFRPGKAVPKHFEGGAERALVERKEDLDPAKMLLRLAAWGLGMRRVAGEKKRAIQFGARTAKMEGGRTKGTDLLVAE